MWRGLSLPPNFQKGGELDRISIFRGGLLGKRGLTFFREGGGGGGGGGVGVGGGGGGGGGG